ncbi:hypothetical protein [Paenibacillus alkalitolerans]|uniref:hypothetical protein n=1 Tax=Paenibacillus alkalitolerans TaxID=2799335 RepID=UPI0018F71F42|nr:hypothetical protein [Paenibacillus alkalitolerans]
MNWDNINRLLDSYTQHKHYHIIFDKYRLPRKGSSKLMAETLYNAVNDKGVLYSIISREAFYDWLTYHQIDGNNYTFVYNLQEKPVEGLLKNLYDNREELIDIKLWEINCDNESEDLSSVMPNLDDIKLVNIHKQDMRYVFSFIAPCLVNGKMEDGAQRLFKKIFFAHCVISSDNNDCKVIFNPTAHLVSVNNTQKDRRTDWSPIANMFFFRLKTYIGDIKIKAPLWIPEALSRFVEEATNHNNPVITQHSFNHQDKIYDFATELMKEVNLDPEKDQAILMKFVQDIQLSFEAQLIEKYGVIHENEVFEIFRQRSDGVTHTIDVASREAGLRAGAAAQAAKRSRADSDIDLLGINYKREDRSYKFLVEQGADAYLVRGTNTFIEEEVVNIVIRKLNQYRDEIQNAAFSVDRSGEGTVISST